MIGSIIEAIIGELSRFVIACISRFGYAGILFTMAVESACIPLPSEIIMPFSGYLVFSGQFTMLGVTLAGAIGDVVGSVAAYYAGIWGGRPFVERYGPYFLVTHRDLDIADRWFLKYGEAAVFFSRMLPVVRTFISLPAGVARMNFPRFVLFTFLGALPWCYLHREVSDKPYAVFSGDALFSGDVGRTDFFGPERRGWASELLYESVTGKLLPLGDQTLVFPAHGAWSVCGSEISDHEFTTIGYEKLSNPLLQISRDEFISRKITEHHYLPPYFKMMEKLNKEGAPLIHRLPDLAAYPAKEVMMQREKAQIVDIRSPTSFAAGHIPGSFSIWKEGIPAFIGWFLNYSDPIILVDDFNCALPEVSRHFVRLG